ncbi:DUF5615 family PIN-like protein [Pleurocapsales cyanobacterium LEGE 10410]|nr:DUF5615 family PIN-like protein [Pleurocapsales cyanobacterium LEGE 10410]
MKFLLDQDVYGTTIKFLNKHGYNFVRVADLDLAQASDAEILRVAQEHNRILITRDRDYGNLVFVKSLGTGVIYLRMLPTNSNAVHKELVRVLETYSEQDLSKAFVVVEFNGHRIRRSPV